MDWIEAFILGVIQGLTEFLPVSSSGHLELAKLILPSQYTGESSMLMTVVLHFATALSTVVIFRKDLMQIIQGLFQFQWNDASKFSVKIIISMIPAALVGVFFDDIIESFFDGATLLVGSMLLATGGLLFLADKTKNTTKEVSLFHSIIIGVAQAIAILPGISRSGATIGTSVLLGIDREKAARFSFLMVVPLIFGKIAKDVLSDKFIVEGLDITALSTGFVAAFITGLVACTWMISLVKKSKLVYFSFYCFVVGIVAIIWSFV
ncbi:MAG: undecaprenyl-diphosphate phosphatase [Flavobacteriales bacterium]|nr:undecaprenyl-diphosphate phosphatase [Flavobacteriales bacterium]